MVRNESVNRFLITFSATKIFDYGLVFYIGLVVVTSTISRAFVVSGLGICLCVIGRYTLPLYCIIAVDYLDNAVEIIELCRVNGL